MTNKIKTKLQQILVLFEEVEGMIETLSPEDFITYRTGQAKALAALIKAENSVIEVIEEIQ